MLTVTNHQGNATQSHDGIARLTCQNWCGEKGTFMDCWWECKLVRPLWASVWKFLKKLKTELLYDLVIPLLGIYPMKRKILT